LFPVAVDEVPKTRGLLHGFAIDDSLFFRLAVLDFLIEAGESPAGKSAEGTTATEISVARASPSMIPASGSSASGGQSPSGTTECKSADNFDLRSLAR
jgi:hypothetical protein